MACVRKFSNSSDTRFAPLSVTTFSGKPCTAKTLWRCLIIATDAVECRMATSGQRIQASSQTNKLSPEGKGPHRSMCTSCHGLSGITVHCSGLVLDFFATDWQGIQALTTVSTRWTMPDHYTTICLVCTIPWCPSCAWERVVYQRVLGITVQEPCRRTPLFAHSSSLTHQIQYV